MTAGRRETHRFQRSGDLFDVDVAASPEWFGDSRNAYRQIVVRRELAQLVVDASPRDFRTSVLPRRAPYAVRSVVALRRG